MSNASNELQGVFNELRLDLYDLSIANGSIGPGAQREFAEEMVANLAKAEQQLAELIGRSAALVKWQYHTLSLEPEGPFPLDTEKELNALGRDGWEMISAIRAHDSSGITTMYFKRPLEEV